MRIITGALAFFDSSAGITVNTELEPLLPNPPPVYSLMMTTSDGWMPTQRATAETVRMTLCVEQCMYNLPLRQYAIAVRVSSGMWLVFGPTNVSSMTTAASAKPFSRSPYDHSSLARPSGSCPSGAVAKSSSVHFHDCSSGFDGVPAAAAGRIQALPSVLGSGPPGRRLSTGSTTKGSGSNSTTIFSIASVAVSSSTAATARIGSPS